VLDLDAHLSDPRTLRAWRELVATLAERNEAHPSAGGRPGGGAPGIGGGHLVMIGPEALPAGAECVPAHSAVVEPPLPDAARAEEVIRSTLKRMNRLEPIQVELTRTALDTVVRSVAGLSPRQIERVINEVVAEDRRFDQHDIRKVLTAKRRALATEGALEYVEAPATLDRVGGLANVKAWLARRKGALSAEAAEFGLTPPRGVLLLGVQGAGKSLCAKAIATAWNRLLLRLDAGSLYDKFVGESEKRLRQALHQAEAMAPVVLWIDEIEKAFAAAGSTSNDGGLSRRMFGSLLTWMQEHRSQVFLVATANDIEALPPELLRKGRFDEIFFIDLPTEPVRREIIAIHLSRRKRDPGGFDLAALAAASEGFSGAEIEQAIMSALYDAFAAGAELDTPRLSAAMRASPPLSVTMAEKLEALRAWGRDRCVPAD
jgi:SpoVK/Ycf46/Vps4 family AAA+-type ATPase